MAKYRFRKMFFQCANKRVIEPQTQMVNAYQKREVAESNMESRNTHMLWEDKTIPLPLRTVEGFYLVHESLFDEILKPYAKDENN